MVAALKKDPAGWYKANKLTPPPEIAEAADAGKHPEELRARHEAKVRGEHRGDRWAHFSNIALGIWLVTQPPMIGVEEVWLARTEIGLGAALILFATLALSWRMGWARFACAAVGALVMAAPFLFSTANSAAYLSDTLVGALVFGFAICTRPDLGPSPLAATSRTGGAAGVEFQPVLVDAAAADHCAGAHRAAGVALSRCLSARPCRQRVGTVLHGIAG